MFRGSKWGEFPAIEKHGFFLKIWDLPDQNGKTPKRQGIWKFFNATMSLIFEKLVPNLNEYFHTYHVIFGKFFSKVKIWVHLFYFNS